MPVFGKTLGDSPADALGGAGDEGDGMVQDGGHGDLPDWPDEGAKRQRTVTVMATSMLLFTALEYGQTA